VLSANNVLRGVLPLFLSVLIDVSCRLMETLLDRWIPRLDQALRTLAAPARAERASPADATPAGADLADDERRLSGALMRVNHVGEVCAQALYSAQALTARSAALRRQMDRAAHEETDHLAWTEQRISELGSRPSLLNPLWYAGAFSIGLAAGRWGDRVSLGFVLETERQVEQHLNSHLDRLPAADRRSRAIVEVMRDDEQRHAEQALQSGAVRFPLPVRLAMRAAARVMTTVAHRV
jgi:ubiquinone biosynthesis monooxygenase Coq7